MSRSYTMESSYCGCNQGPYQVRGLWEARVRRQCALTGGRGASLAPVPDLAEELAPGQLSPCGSRRQSVRPADLVCQSPALAGERPGASLRHAPPALTEPPPGPIRCPGTFYNQQAEESPVPITGVGRAPLPPRSGCAVSPSSPLISASSSVSSPPPGHTGAGVRRASPQRLSDPCAGAEGKGPDKPRSRCSSVNRSSSWRRAPAGAPPGSRSPGDERE